jgi:hypothetical protein
MTRLAGFAAAVSLLLFSAGAAAQTYKCVNDAGKVTYSSAACANLGLKDAGEVKQQINLAPAQQIPPPAPPAPKKPPPSAAANSNPEAPAKADAPAVERRCFATKTGTRCNEGQVDANPVPVDDRAAGENKAQ